MYRELLTNGSSTFRAPFIIGASTAAYQIEGAVTADGRGPSIWDTFSHTPGKIDGGATGDVAADHYHRVDADLDLMAGLHLDAYRFSISWPRVIPDGDGGVNRRGVDFYSHLVDGLIARGIEPIVTLNHWDLPQSLEDRYGGWRGRQTAYAFGRYAEIMGAALGDRVSIWSTHNEPWNNSFAGYGSGSFAPGIASHEAALRAAHHLNLAHGLGVAALRRTITRPEARVSVCLNIFRIEAEPGHEEAVRRVDAVANRVFMGPMLTGEYPADLIDYTKDFTDWGFVLPGDLAASHQPLDLLGLNYYEVMHVRCATRAAGGRVSMGGTMFPGFELVDVIQPDHLARTGMGWGIEARGLRDHLLALSREFPDLPLMVMENGAAFADRVALVDGRPAVYDRDRTQYLVDHASAVHEAIERGANVVGYLVWSLLDNFEWTSGYGPRFGVVRVDYDTQARIPKLSAHWLSQLCTTRTIPHLTHPT